MGVGVASYDVVVDLVHMPFQALVHILFSLVVTEKLAQALAFLVEGDQDEDCNESECCYHGQSDTSTGSGGGGRGALRLR